MILKMRLVVFILVSVAIAVVRSDTERCATDIVFLVDHSSSITPIIYKTKVLPFLVNLTKGLSIDVDGDHVAFVPFSDTEVTHVKFFLNKYNKQEDIINAIQDHDFQGGNTATAKALGLARSDVFLDMNGARREQYKKNIAPTALIITDGIATDSDPVSIAEDLRLDGVAIFAVGVGSLVQQDYLVKITGDQSRVFPVSDYKDLNQKLAETIIDSTTQCKERNGVLRKG